MVKKKYNRHPNGKATKLEAERRLETVKTLLIRNFNKYEIFDYFTKPPIKDGKPIRPPVILSMESVDKYIFKAWEEIQNYTSPLHEKEFAKQMAKLDDLEKEARARGKLREAIDILKEKSSLLNLYPPPKRSKDDDPDKVEYDGAEFVD